MWCSLKKIDIPGLKSGFSAVLKKMGSGAISQKNMHFCATPQFSWGGQLECQDTKWLSEAKFSKKYPGIFQIRSSKWQFLNIFVRFHFARAKTPSNFLGYVWLWGGKHCDATHKDFAPDSWRRCFVYIDADMKVGWWVITTGSNFLDLANLG